MASFAFAQVPSGFYTDSIVGEKIVVSSDRAVYDWVSGGIVQVAIFNADSKAHEITWGFFIDNTQVDVEYVLEERQKVKYKDTYFFEVCGLLSNIEVVDGNGSHFKQQCDDADAETKDVYNGSFKIKKRVDAVVYYEWEEVSTRKVFLNRGNVPERMIKKKTIDTITLGKNELIVLRAKIKVPVGSEGEFYIRAEAVDDPTVFGELDPWWRNDAGNRYPVNISMGATASDVNTTFRFNTTVAAIGLTVASDMNRIVTVDQDGNVEIARVVDLNINTGDVNVFFKPRQLLGANTDYNGTDLNGIMIYVRDTNTADTNGDYDSVFWWGTDFEVAAKRGTWTEYNPTSGVSSFASALQKNGKVGTVYQIVQTGDPAPHDALQGHVFPKSADYNVMIEADLFIESTGSIMYQDNNANFNCPAAQDGCILYEQATTTVRLQTPINNFPTIGAHDNNSWYTARLNIRDVNATGTIANAVGTGTGGMSASQGAYVGLLSNSGGSGKVTRLDNLRVYKILVNQPLLTLGTVEEYTGLTIDYNTLEGISFDVGFPPFSQTRNGNISLVIRLTNENDTNANIIDINLSSSSTQGTGRIYYNDINLNETSNCENFDFSSSACTFDFNTALVGDGNYYFLIDYVDNDKNTFQASSITFNADNTPPSVVDVNFSLTTGFGIDNNGSAIIQCYDNNSSSLRNTIRINDSNVVDGNFAVSSLASTDYAIPTGSTTLTGFCFDLAGNSATEQNTVNSYIKNFVLINEDTGLDFNAMSISSVIGTDYTTGTDYNFQADNNASAWFRSINDSKIRITFGYGSGVFIPRDFNFSAITDVNTVKVCGVDSGNTFFKQFVLSSKRRKAVLISQQHDCYIMASYTQNSNDDLLMITGYTVSKLYDLITDIGTTINTKISEIDGSESNNHNLDILEENRNIPDFSLSGQTFTLDINYTDLNTPDTANFYYYDILKTTTRAVLTVYNGTSSTVYETHTETASPNNFTFSIPYADLEALDVNDFLATVYATRTDGSSNTISLNFTLNKTKALLEPAFVAIIAFFVMLLGLTIASSRITFNWLGLIVCIIALAITTMAVGVWFIVFLQAIIVTVLAFVGISMWKENSAVA